MAEDKRTDERDQETGTIAPDFGEVFASWEFPGHEKHERSKRWYLISTLIIIAIFAYSYYDNNPLLAVIVILGLIAFIMSEMRGPDYHNFTITEDGLLVGQVIYPYDELKNFYIIYQPPNIKMLYIEPKSILRPRIGVPLQDEDPVAIREILLNFLPEDIEKEDEPTSDFLGRLFKF